MENNKKVDMIVDMQYGSTGKGLIAGYLAKRNGYDVVVNANMPNAGHTYIDDCGNKMVFKVLPNGIVSPNLKYVLIGPGSVFRLDRLIDEIKLALSFGYMEDVAVFIHPNAVPLTDEHVSKESLFDRIGSTKQGSMAAMVDKMERDPDGTVIADYPIFADYMEDLDAHEYGIYVTSHQTYNQVLKEANNVLAEGAQGFSLGINERFYPYCTSRDCTPTRFMSDMGIPHTLLRKVIGTARTFPIRVGGTSGGCYHDQIETSWERLGLPVERTTVTNKVRRVFTFSSVQIYDADWAMQPDEVFLNFCNYVDRRDLGIEIKNNKKVKSNELMGIIDCFRGKVRYLGYGPGDENVYEI